MAVPKKPTKRGQHKLEFYAALEEIKDLYFDKGYVVYTLLYEHLKEKYNWEMSYITFNKYAKRELVFDTSKTGGSKRSSQVKTPKKILSCPLPKKRMMVLQLQKPILK